MRAREDASFIPTPQRIRGMCNKIRASWTESERQRRLVTAEWTPWRVPEVDLPYSVSDQFERE